MSGAENHSKYRPSIVNDFTVTGPLAVRRNPASSDVSTEFTILEGRSAEPHTRNRQVRDSNDTYELTMHDNRLTKPPLTHFSECSYNLPPVAGLPDGSGSRRPRTAPTYGVQR